MIIIEKLKNVIKSNSYMVSDLGIYYNEFLRYKNLTRISFHYYLDSKILYCGIVFYQNKKYIKTLKIIINIE